MEKVLGKIRIKKSEWGDVSLNIPEFKGSMSKESRFNKVLSFMAIVCVLIYCIVSITKGFSQNTYIKEQDAVIKAQDAFIGKQREYIKILEYKLRDRVFIPEIRTDLLKGSRK